MAIRIERVPVLSDNYVWLLHDGASGETVAIDPGEAAPVLAAADTLGWQIGAIWNTHWHPDHTAGNAAVKAATGASVTGPAAEAAKIPGGLDRGIGEGDALTLGAHRAVAMHVPGHTAGHLAFHFADDALLVTGDTLFAMGCGRLFEGTAAEMYANMARYRVLPPETQVLCGHEYTQANGRFALAVDPDNAALRARMAEVDRLRAAGEATVPTTIAAELATNPFLRAQSAVELRDLRERKDAFRG
jgi:hydroxyacylglutathione hydrolase